ncbi:MAG: DNA adenine methylase [Bacteroidota bacterium]
MRYPQHLDSFYHRLRGVVIEERDAARALAQHDTAETLHYVDPPYPRSTRTTNGDAYAHEMTDDDHRALARLLRSLEGMVILSGYPCELYDGELYPDWHRTEIAAVKSSQNASVPATEVVWLNEAAREAQRQRSLFSGVNA